ncbi:DNA-binding protein [Corallococcus sp. CA053C]|uniref:helix-turn-helix domain-containing protein n=1 Tax=Corallococcus sp. CA053C TaxID=2316732 RepID=UPI000EA3678F|nr:helix-turn-helix domain-containing protein [Corallococcus sp. CA053C]RKH09748.1 DNA-binding protein [Corallococcus sp. CA053C]
MGVGAMRDNMKQDGGSQAEGHVAPGYWTVEQAAKYLQVSKSWLYRQTEAGLVPVVRMGRSLRYRKADLDAWAAAQRAA